MIASIQLMLLCLVGAPDAPSAPEVGSPAAEPTSVVDEQILLEVAALERLATADLPDVSLRSLFEVELSNEAAVAARVSLLKAEETSAKDDLHRTRARLRLAFLMRPQEERQRLLEANDKRQRIAVENEAALKERDRAAEAVLEAEERRKQALEEAQATQDAAERAAAEHRAREEALRSLLARMAADMAEQRETLSHDRSTLFETERRFASQTQTASAADRDALYDNVVKELVVAREQLASALAKQKGTIAGDLVGQVKASPVGTVLLAQAQDLEHLEQTLTADRLELYVDHARTLNQLRLELLAGLSDEKRNSVLGVSREGLSQLFREVNHARLIAVAYAITRPRQLLLAPQALSDAATASIATLEGLRLLVGFLILLTVWRRRGRLFEGLRERLARLARTRGGLFVHLVRWVAALEAVAEPAVSLAAAYLFVSSVEHLVDAPEVTLGKRLLLTVMWYRLILAGVHYFIVSAAESRRTRLSPAASVKVLASIRMIGRYALAIVLLGIVTQAVVGTGYLYHIAIDLAWLGAMPIMLSLSHLWHSEVAHVYVDMHPRGRLSEAFRNGQQRFYHSLLAGSWVVFRGVTSYVSQLVLELRQARRLAAFLFRRRLEKHAQQDTPIALADLPEALRKAFDEDAAPAEALLPKYPELDDVLGQVRQWKKGLGGAPVALVGERGVGKTTWLRELQKQADDIDCAYLCPEQRLLTSEDVAGYLAAQLGLGEASSAAQVTAALRNGPKRLVLIDLGQHFFLRAVNGMRGLDTLADIIGLSGTHVFWVVSFARYAWNNIQTIYAGRNVFETVVRLEGWGEEDIAELIQARMQVAKFTAEYKDLVIEQLSGTSFHAEVIQTEERFMQLLWDYADGNPRVAMHFWLRSLVPKGEGVVSVRLFAAPAPEDLESLQERARFLLASLLTHESLTVSEAAAALRFHPSLIESTFGYLRRRGIVWRQSERYRVSTTYNRALLRLLHRKHLIFE